MEASSGSDLPQTQTRATVRRGEGSRPRGRPVAARTIRGTPNDRPSIIVMIGGRWFDTMTHGLYYNGGRTRYIHNVDPATFKARELLMAAYKLRGENEVVPTQFWYHPHGELQWPAALECIDGDAQMVEMWNNVAAHGKRAAVIVMQDVFEEFDPKSHALIYHGPASVHCGPSSLKWGDYLQDALYEMYTNSEWGPYANWEAITGGQDWYVSSLEFPMVQGV